MGRPRFCRYSQVSQRQRDVGHPTVGWRGGERLLSFQAEGEGEPVHSLLQGRTCRRRCRQVSMKQEETQLNQPPLNQPRLNQPGGAGLASGNSGGNGPGAESGAPYPSASSAGASSDPSSSTSSSPVESSSAPAIPC